ncbi:30S ribosomal protein S4e [Candidatus Methanoperedenaceae archaeon GB37]|nr:30S ribosomal protein S4e [Candidatus Methanoperedenaceae archaeon GB37]
MSRHEKRVAAPKSWPIPRKTSVWVVKPRPGPHSKDRSLPLGLIIRDVLRLATTLREVKKILHDGSILVDGRVRRDYKFPVGLFDLIAIPKMDKYYRMLLDRRGRLELRRLEGKDTRKLCKIVNKTILSGGRVQLNLHDGTNLLGTNEYNTGDSLILSLPDKEISKHLRFAEGKTAMIIGGKHSGEIGRIAGRRVVRGSAPNMVRVMIGEREVETPERYVYVIGEDEPEITIGCSL